MDKDLQDVLTYGLGTLGAYSGIMWALYSFFKDTNFTIIYTLLITAFLWMAYLQIKLSKKTK
jgi:hypothetical protein